MNTSYKRFLLRCFVRVCGGGLGYRESGWCEMRENKSTPTPRITLHYIASVSCIRQIALPIFSEHREVKSASPSTVKKRYRKEIRFKSNLDAIPLSSSVTAVKAEGDCESGVEGSKKKKSLPRCQHWHMGHSGTFPLQLVGFENGNFHSRKQGLPGVRQFHGLP